MKVIELKFYYEDIKGEKEKIVELLLLENPIMKYVLRDRMFEENQTRQMEGDVPSFVLKNMKMFGGLKNGK